MAAAARKDCFNSRLENPAAYTEEFASLLTSLLSSLLLVLLLPPAMRMMAFMAAACWAAWSVDTLLLALLLSSWKSGTALSSPSSSSASCVSAAGCWALEPSLRTKLGLRRLLGAAAGVVVVVDKSELLELPALGVGDPLSLWTSSPSPWPFAPPVMPLAPSSIGSCLIGRDSVPPFSSSPSLLGLSSPRLNVGKTDIW
jgi:hypothetical protein